MQPETSARAQLRAVELADAPVLADLVTQLGYPTEPEQIRARLLNLLPAGDGLLAAEVNGVTVGLVHVRRLLTIQLEAAAEIMALVVDSRWRSQGIGRRLLQAAEEWARERSYLTLYVRTNILRERAHRFYFRNGFRQIKTSLTLAKEL